METYSSTQVFTPSQPATLTFVDREEVNERLVRALQTPGKQIVVYGHTGCGKSTLLTNKLKQLYENHITTRCTRGITFQQILLDAFDQLDLYYPETFSGSSKNSISASLAAQFAVIKASLRGKREESNSSSSKRLLPPQLTPQNLARFLGAIRCCWVLEDFHKTKPEHKEELAQLMKIFMDMAQEFPEVKIIAIGAVNTARQVVSYDREMANRVVELHVPLMDNKKINEILGKGETLLRIKFSKGVKRRIVDISNGLAAVCHQLALSMCFDAGVHERRALVKQLSDTNLQRAIAEYAHEASDTYKEAFDCAQRQKKQRRFQNGRLIMQALTGLPLDGATRADIYASIVKTEPDYPQGNLTQYLDRLQTEEYGEVIRKDEASRKYAFRDPFFRAFVMAQLSSADDVGRDEILEFLIDIFRKEREG